jgi:polysaccharide biosynthesis protein VpsJ
MMMHGTDFGRVESIIESVRRGAAAEGYAGYDPFDGLNSRLFDLMPQLKTGILGLAWIQFHKRSRINFRPIFQVPKGRNPKGVGLFILGLLENFHRTGNTAFLDEAKQLGDWLLENSCDKKVWRHCCWGYHFDWNARAFFVPKGKPNVITTVYVAQALLALSDVLEDLRYADAAYSAGDFIFDILLTENEGRRFIAYIPGETAFVHNASLWGAAWLAVVESRTRSGRFGEVALDVTRRSIAEQLLDGSWVYGSKKHHQFIDGFHTGYNLEALDLIQNSLNTKEFSSSIINGLNYYKNNFFESDGAVKYYNNNKYPLDMHSVTQAILTLLKVGKSDDCMNLACKSLVWSINNMYMPDKDRFAYQLYKNYKNEVDYIRWTRAWVYYAFSFYLNRTTR